MGARSQCRCQPTASTKAIVNARPGVPAVITPGLAAVMPAASRTCRPAPQAAMVLDGGTPQSG